MQARNLSREIETITNKSEKVPKGNRKKRILLTHYICVYVPKLDQKKLIKFKVHQCVSCSALHLDVTIQCMACTSTHAHVDAVTYSWAVRFTIVRRRTVLWTHVAAFHRTFSHGQEWFVSALAAAISSFRAFHTIGVLCPIIQLVQWVYYNSRLCNISMECIFEMSRNQAHSITLNEQELPL